MKAKGKHKSAKLQKCPTCGSDSYKNWFTEKRFRRFRCTNKNCSRRNFDERDLIVEEG
jgi:hypothetical protein